MPVRATLIVLWEADTDSVFVNLEEYQKQNNLFCFSLTNQSHKLITCKLI